MKDKFISKITSENPSTRETGSIIGDSELDKFKMIGCK